MKAVILDKILYKFTDKSLVGYFNYKYCKASVCQTRLTKKAMHHTGVVVCIEIEYKLIHK